jgi:hypothetical protein
MTKTATKAAALTWEEASLDAAAEVSNGTVLHPLTREVIAKVVNGRLDVRRPSHLSRPDCKATDDTIGKAFGSWYLSGPYSGGEVTPEEVATVLQDPAYTSHPSFEVPADEYPLAFVTCKRSDGASFLFMVVNGSIARAGLLSDKSVRWVYSAKLRDGSRKASYTPKITKAGEVEAIVKALMGSFGGKFAGEPKSEEKPAKAKSKEAVPADATTDTKPAKQAPAKKVPTKKK